MRFLLSFVLCCLFYSTFSQADVLIRNGKILDGTGNSWFYGDIAVKDAKILAIGKLTDWSATREIDAGGLYITPGFIDVHTHIEGDEVLNPEANNFIYDGVTSVVTGNCGSSKVDIAAYFKFLDSLKLSVNVATLIGHNDVRKAVMGRAKREPSAEELIKMKHLVGQAMKDGAVGLSTGLIYVPGTYSGTDEVAELARVAALYNGVYASHIRDEGDSVVAAINEAMHIGLIAKIPVEISHFKVSGQQNWGRSDSTLSIIKTARKNGLDVTIDQYPYTASSTSLSTLLPEWVLADGSDSMIARLNKADIKKQVVDYLVRNLHRRKLLHFDYAVVASFEPNNAYNGKSIEAINLLKGRTHSAVYEAETIIEMMKSGGAGMVFHGISEEDVVNIIKYPFNMFASDASIRVFKKGMPHPRGYGTNARVLARYVRDKKVISLEEAVRRMTSLPALKFHLKDRGLIKEGFAADLLIFDDNKVQDLSTFEQPHQYAKGFKYVLVNGIITLDNGVSSGIRNGKILRNAP